MTAGEIAHCQVIVKRRMQRSYGIRGEFNSAAREADKNVGATFRTERPTEFSSLHNPADADRNVGDRSPYRRHSCRHSCRPVRTVDLWAGLHPQGFSTSR